ncbi:MAG: hypothetical protein ACLF0G_16225 [Candidatus Brocadiia bacterium]
MTGRTQWSRLGWHGIVLEVPAEWCPGRLEGDRANGYLRVEDETRIRLELRWETPRRGKSSARRLVDNYLERTRKKLGRKAPQPKVDRHRYVPQLGDVDHEVFTWRGGFHAHSLLFVCPQSNRVVHVRVFFEPGREARGLVRRIFASARTTGEGEKDEWSVFGLRFLAGPAWRLERSALRTGCLQMVFRRGREELEVARVSLAEVVLRDQSLRQWFVAFFAKLLKRCRYELSAQDYRQHPAVRCTGQVRPGSLLLGLFRRRLHVTALAWHCAADDKVFVVRVLSRSPRDPEAAGVAETVPCG